MSNYAYLFSLIALLFFMYLMKDNKLFSVLSLIFFTITTISFMVITENDFELSIATLILIFGILLNINYISLMFKHSEED